MVVQWLCNNGEEWIYVRIPMATCTYSWRTINNWYPICHRSIWNKKIHISSRVGSILNRGSTAQEYRKWLIIVRRHLTWKLWWSKLFDLLKPKSSTYYIEGLLIVWRRIYRKWFTLFRQYAAVKTHTLCKVIVTTNTSRYLYPPLRILHRLLYIDSIWSAGIY